jgi:hypothetical protein
MKLLTKLLAVFSVVMLTGCASAVNTMALFYDQRDPCQTLNKPSNHVRPAWCHTPQSRATVYNSAGHVIGYIRAPR